MEHVYRFALLSMMIVLLLIGISSAVMASHIIDVDVAHFIPIDSQFAVKVDANVAIRSSVQGALAKTVLGYPGDNSHHRSDSVNQASNLTVGLYAGVAS